MPARERHEVDDIVLVRVAGHVYLQKVLAVEQQRRRARIGNNRGGVNGWAGLDRILRNLRRGRRSTPSTDGWQGPSGR